MKFLAAIALLSSGIIAAADEKDLGGVRREAKSKKNEMREDRRSNPNTEDCVPLLEGTWKASENITQISSAVGLFDDGVQFTTSEYFALNITATEVGNTLTAIHVFPSESGVELDDKGLLIGGTENVTMLGFYRPDCTFHLLSEENSLVIEGGIRDGDVSWVEASMTGPDHVMAYSGMYEKMVIESRFFFERPDGCPNRDVCRGVCGPFGQCRFGWPFCNAWCKCLDPCPN